MSGSILVTVVAVSLRDVDSPVFVQRVRRARQKPTDTDTGLVAGYKLRATWTAVRSGPMTSRVITVGYSACGVNDGRLCVALSTQCRFN